MDDHDEYYGPMGLTFKHWDSMGPESLEATDRYSRADLQRDLADAVLDPLSEATGRLVRACTVLEIAMCKALVSVEKGMTFAKAEDLKKRICLKRLRSRLDALTEPRRTNVLALLDDIEQALELRNGVVHGIYRKNFRTGQYESRRYPTKKSDTRRMIHIPYDRGDLIRAAMRVTNMAADLLEYRHRWGRELGVSQGRGLFEGRGRRL